MCKKLTAGILCFVMLAAMLPAMAFAAEDDPFKDVTEKDWYYNSVQYVYDNGLMSGVSDTMFDPNGTLTREQFVTILGRYAKVDTSKYKAVNFKDVKAGQWYTPYIDWAYQKQITSGTSSTTFGVGDPITREQMAVMITRYLDRESIELPLIDNPISEFKDLNKVSPWALDALEVMRKSGLINGDERGNFSPSGQTTRAMAAAIFERMVKAIKSRHINGFDNVGFAGETFTFGTYEQDNNLKNGREPITWKILAVEDGKALLISDYILDQKKFNDASANVTWESSSMRKWLNNEFMYTAFSGNEISKIATTTVMAEKNPAYPTIDPGKNTHDKVFLLSVNESKKYFATKRLRYCAPTDYAIARGANHSTTIALDGRGCGDWWLRSPGYDSRYAAYVRYDGDVDTRNTSVNSYGYGVRPAVWININDIAAMHGIDNIGEEGTTFKFGAVDQDFDLSNGKEEIQWIVLAKEDDKALVISKYALDAMAYRKTDGAAAWEDSAIRSWLNEDFINDAFTESEASKILTSTVTADKNPDYATNQGADTQDRVFLLSSEEVKKYFSDPRDRKCTLTETAYAHDGWTSEFIEEIEDNSEVGAPDYEENQYSCFWWLRTAGGTANDAAIVFCDGTILNEGVKNSFDMMCVRPAMWVSLK